MSDLQAEVERLHAIIVEFVYAERECKESDRRLKELNDQADRLHGIENEPISDDLALRRKLNLDACIAESKFKGAASRRLYAARQAFEELVKEANNE